MNKNGQITEQSRQSGSRFQRFVDLAKTWALVVLILVVLCVFAALIWVWVDFLKRVSESIVIAWAIIATVLVFVASAASFVAGHAFGVQKTQWFLQGVTNGAIDIASVMSKFGTSAADVRMYAAKGLGFLGMPRESTDSQELFLDRLPNQPREDKKEVSL